MAMRSQSFYASLSNYMGTVQPYVVKKPEYPAFIDGIDCKKKMDKAMYYRFRKAEQRTKNIDKIITALLIANFLIFILPFVPQAYYPFFLVIHFIILISGYLNTTIFRKRREKKIQLAFRLTWFS